MCYASAMTAKSASTSPVLHLKLLALGIAYMLLCVYLTPAHGEVVTPEAATGRTETKSGTAQSFMVAAAHPLAAAAGVEIIKSGGNAMDAAIAVQLVLNMVEPQSSGIGGGAFLLYWDAKAKTLTTFDGRELAPAAATEGRFLTKDGQSRGRMDAIVGGLSVGVPGVVRMLGLAHERHGKLPWAAGFAPAVRIAEQGFPISPRLHRLLEQDPALRDHEPARSYFYRQDGTPKRVGEILRNPSFAKTLHVLAAKGAAPFYEGEIANHIVETVRAATANSGDLTTEDLNRYHALERPPVCGAYRAYRICGMGPPTSGGVGVIQTLGLLEPFDLRALGPASTKAYHLLAEAGRLVFADRAVYLADPDIIPVPTDALLAPAYLRARSKLIRVDKRKTDVEAGKVPVKGPLILAPAASPELRSTSHFSIVDRNGNAVAMTSSIENAFGSRLMTDGFLLNNTLTDFSYSEAAKGRAVANRVGANKRPRSSMAPTMVFNKAGDLEFILGSPGGPAIVAFVAKTLVAMLDWDMTPADAAAAPYVLDFGSGLMIDPQLADAKPELESLGAEVSVIDFPSGLHVIHITPGQLIGGADPRREGVVLGE